MAKIHDNDESFEPLNPKHLTPEQIDALILLRANKIRVTNNHADKMFLRSSKVLDLLKVANEKLAEKLRDLNCQSAKLERLDKLNGNAASSWDTLKNIIGEEAVKNITDG